MGVEPAPEVPAAYSCTLLPITGVEPAMTLLTPKVGPVGAGAGVGTGVGVGVGTCVLEPPEPQPASNNAAAVAANNERYTRWKATQAAYQMLSPGAIPCALRLSIRSGKRR